MSLPSSGIWDSKISMDELIKLKGRYYKLDTGLILNTLLKLIKNPCGKKGY
jgi:hypothetical protein